MFHHSNVREEQRLLDSPNAKATRATYGESIGVLVLDTNHPRIPGDVANATTFPFPVKFKVVKEIYAEEIVCKKPDASVCRRFIEEGRELEKDGVRAITTSCGYFIYFQDEMADALNVPVFASSLIQVPLVARMLGKNKRVGIMCASPKNLTETHLRKAGVDDSMLVAVSGMGTGIEGYWNWRKVARNAGPKDRLAAYETGLSRVLRDWFPSTQISVP